MLSVDAVDFYMYIYTISTESGLHQSRRCVDRRTGGRNLCTGACNHGTSSDSADNAYNVLCLLTKLLPVYIPVHFTVQFCILLYVILATPEHLRLPFGDHFWRMEGGFHVGGQPAV